MNSRSLMNDESLFPENRLNLGHTLQDVLFDKVDWQLLLQQKQSLRKAIKRAIYEREEQEYNHLMEIYILLDHFAECAQRFCLSLVEKNNA